MKLPAQASPHSAIVRAAGHPRTQLTANEQLADLKRY